MPSPDSERRIVICDASPLIFLAKTGRLDLIGKVLPGRQVVLGGVVREILADGAGPLETDRLRMWLEQVEVIEYEDSLFPASALSRSDQSTLAWAVNHGAAWLVADERLLRRIAVERGIAVIGFCGLLVKAVQRGLLSSQEGRRLLDEAIDDHGLRISVTLYRRILEALP